LFAMSGASAFLAETEKEKGTAILADDNPFVSPQLLYAGTPLDGPSNRNEAV
jgi:hypothetical protein